MSIEFGVLVFCVVGGLEIDEFKRQVQILLNGLKVDLLIVIDVYYMSILGNFYFLDSVLIEVFC